MLSARPTVLAVDDGPVNLLLLKAILEQDFNVFTATSGQQGLDMAAQLQPDLILLDVMMPGLDGFETCERLKADPALSKIPVVFITSQNDTASEAKGLALGAVDYLAKPLKASTARLRIANLLERESLRKQVEAQRDLLEAQMRQRERADEQLRLAANVFAHAAEGITITGLDGKIIDVNDAFCRITGYSRDEVVGKNPNILSSGKQDAAFYADMWRSLVQQGHWHGEVWNRRKDGEVYAEMLTISTVRNAAGKPEQYVALFSDITASKQHQSQLEHIAHFDALTNLPNRVLLSDRMRQAMAQTLRRGQMLAMAYIDLDGFKRINDLHGHEVGDEVLIALAQRMKPILREGDSLARMGGDEFAAVLVDLPTVADSVPMLTRLLEATSQPLTLGELTLQVSASIGVTFYPQADEVDADQLLRQADQAMYQAKLAGKNRYHVFDNEQDRSVRGHHESLDHIRLALERNEFVLHYQPKVNMRTGQVVGAEALIRWQHPERGLLAPAVFLPVIEDHALSINVGDWVIDTALAQMAMWRTAGLHLPVSVNIGARQLQDPQFVSKLAAHLAAHPSVAPTDLELELLETSALEDVVRISKVIEACKHLGVHFSLDDFGTGYSSLTYLKRLPVGLLKIDQSFVRDMLDDPDDLAILDGVIGLARAFGRRVIAEGVETIEHGEMLLQLGCEHAQGYGVARPMPADRIPAWASSWQPDVLWKQAQVVPHDTLPVLNACVEHRAWVNALEAYFTGERETPPPLHPDHCNFGKWLRDASLLHPQSVQLLQTIDSAHRVFHHTAEDLCAKHVQRTTGAAPVNMLTLHAQSTALIALLEQFIGQCGQRP
jgi:diguanylate cyclase (GGDEF)-like protein/PAS domain S-box-containing protein